MATTHQLCVVQDSEEQPLIVRFLPGLEMSEDRENGSRLGWLIDPQTRKVYVYRPRKRIETLDDPKRLSGDPELPGLVLKLAKIWDLES